MRVLLSVLLFAFLVVSTSSLLRDVGPRAPDDQQDSDLTVEEILPEEPQETGIEALQQAVAQTQNILRSFVEHLDKGCLHSDEVPKEKEEADADAPSQSGTDDIIWEMKGADAFRRFNLEDDILSIPKGADAFRRFNLEDDMIRIPKRSNIDFHHVGKRETHDCSECLPGEDGDPGYPGRPGMPGLKGEPGDVGPPGPPGRSEWRRRRPSHRDHRRHRGTHEDRWDRGTHRHVRSIDRADLYPEDNFDRPRGPPARPAGPPIKGPKGERGDDGYPGLPGLDGLEGAPGTFRDRTYEHVESVVRNYIKDTCTCKAEHRNH